MATAIRTTLRAIRKQLPGRYPGTRLLDADCQDEIACYLLGQRGIDKWLAGRLSLDTLIGNLAQEWASIPKPDGKRHYAGQDTGVSVSQVKAALAEVARGHADRQPKIEVKVPVAVDQPVVPKTIEKAVKKQSNGWAEPRRRRCGAHGNRRLAVADHGAVRRIGCCRRHCRARHRAVDRWQGQDDRAAVEG